MLLLLLLLLLRLSHPFPVVCSSISPHPDSQNTLNIIALSIEPFWELFDEEDYFYKLFVLVLDMFEWLWSQLGSDETSFTRVFCDTEEKLEELLKTSPSCVADLRAAWADMCAAALESAHDDEAVEDAERADGAEMDAAGAQDGDAASAMPAMESPSRVSKKSSFTYRQEDFSSKLMNASTILTTDHVAYIDRVLPITCQLCRWFLLYSTETHGSSLHTLLMLAKSESPTLVVVKDENDHVFGGFASDEWHTASQYYGNGETFLFTFADPKQFFIKYAWGRRNSYCMLCSEESLVMGGGGSFGLYLVRRVGSLLYQSNPLEWN